MTVTGVEPVNATNDPVAHEALRAAHDGGYRFPEDFGGFAASFTASESDGERVVTITGRTTIAAPRDVVVESDGPDELGTWAKQELSSMAGHRWNTPYEAGDGRWTLTIGEEDENPLGRLVTVHDDPFDSAYRIRDGRISQVVRSMGDTRFTISIQSHTKTSDGRFLPATFSVAFWDTSTGTLTRSDAYTDAYEPVDGVLLPASRRVLTATDSGLVARELVLTGWKRLANGDDARRS